MFEQSPKTGAQPKTSRLLTSAGRWGLFHPVSKLGKALAAGTFFTNRLDGRRLVGLLVACLLAVFASTWFGERPARMDGREANTPIHRKFPRGITINPATNKIYAGGQALSHSIVPFTAPPLVANAVYDSVLKAPKCGSPGSVCESGTLLNGRDNISGGAEPNQPNTINNSCADGTIGVYHSDESIDAIKVSTLDAGNLATGKTVKIEVTVWAYSSFSSDHLDLYRAADASNPNWIYLTTLEPSAAGAQVLSTTYPLPNGASVQAVRARFRYTGGASSCDFNTGYDDYDDLLFAVQPSAMRTLTVASSNPASGVNISVSPNDNNAAGNGTTQFTRVYNINQSVSLTAPATAGGNTFQKWLKDGADFPSNQTTSTTVAMNDDHTMTAVYLTPPRTLTVASSNPASGVNITVSPNDNNSAGNGATQFTRVYDVNTSVDLTAPETAGGHQFQKWLKDGADFPSNQTRSTSVAMDADHTMTAVYLTPTDGCEAHISIQGSVPTGIAINPVTNKIYVASQVGSIVDVINGADNSKTTVPAGSSPWALAVNSVTNRIYVANASSDSVTVINGANNSTATVPAGDFPVAVGVNSTTNKIYVANSSSNNVTVINGVDNSTTTVTAGSRPSAVAVNPTTNKIYVANCGATCGGSGIGTVTVINGADNSTATVTTDGGTRYAAVNSTTNKIYVVNISSLPTVTVIDGTNNTTQTIFVGPNPTSLAINAATNKIYVPNSDSTTVTVINGVDNSTSAISGFRPAGVAVNSVTNKIYVGSPDTNNVKVVSGADNSILATIPTGIFPFMMAVNTVTNKIYVPSGGQKLVTVINGNTSTSTCGPTTASVSGNVTNGNRNSISGAVITLTNFSNFTTYSSGPSDSGGNYTINNVPIGINYSASSSSFGVAQYGQPASVLTPLTGDVSGLNFAKSSPNYTAAGTITINGGGGFSGLVVTPIAPNSPFSPFPCPGPITTGAFSCPGLWVDTVYDIVPTKPGYIFTPEPIRVSNNIFTLQYTGNPLATVTTSSATPITQTTATLNGSVNPNGIATSAWFEWGTDPTLTSNTLTPSQSKGSGTSSQALSQNLSGLVAGTTYYFRAVGMNNGGTVKGPILSFATTPNNISVTVQSNPAGRSFIVDGTTHTTAQTVSWTAGSLHTISTTSPQAGATGTQYVWSNWSDSGAISHSVTAPSVNTTYTANFTTQFMLTMSAGTGGTVSPPSGFFNSGQSVQISGTPNSSFSFSGWTGSGSGSFTGSTNPVNVTMNGPITEAASFTATPTIQLMLDSSGPEPDQAAALDSILFLRDPFPVISPGSLNTSDQNTRVMIFVTNLQLAQGDLPSAVSVDLIAGANPAINVPAEDVRPVPNSIFTQVIFKLPTGLLPGTYTIKVKLHNEVSNTGTIGIRL